MEAVAIAGLFGFIIGGIVVFALKDKLSAVDASIHSKLDQLICKVDSNAQAVANHVTAQVANVSGQVAQLDEKLPKPLVAH